MTESQKFQCRCGVELKYFDVGVGGAFRCGVELKYL